MEQKEIYFNFPICLLKDIFIDKNKVFNNICEYAIYKHSLNLEHGTEIDKIKSAAKFYNVTLGSNSNTLKNGKLLNNLYSSNTILTGIRLSIFWDFFKNEKTEFELITLLAFLGIKSILGTKPYCKTNKEFLFNRMSGNAKQGKCKISEPLQKYLIRYHFDKIITELKVNWHLKYYGYHTKGFYVSFDLSIEQLIANAEINRPSKKQKALKDYETSVRKKVIENINNR